MIAGNGGPDCGCPNPPCNGRGSVPLIGGTASNVVGTEATLLGGVTSWGAAEAPQTANFTRNAVKAAKVGGGALSVIAFAPTAYNTGAKVYNGTDNTADWVDFTASGSLLVTGFLVSNPIGLGVLAIGGIGYGIYRIGWGDEADTWINDNFGYRD